nr:MAG TPA: hypothetical protein [Siphoviridae sp. ct4aE30]
MRAFDEFKDSPMSFWAFIRFVTERLGYSKDGKINRYTKEKIEKVCNSNGIYHYDKLVNDAIKYTDMRANLLSGFVKSHLMTGEEAHNEFNLLYPMYQKEHFFCQLPLNKQKGEMKQIAYFTAIINILTEKTIRNITGNYHDLGFDDDPRGLTYVYDDKHSIIGASSRRFDGAYPSINNPTIVWEIKEYYYNKSFGSRIADGVYETQLDGYEFRDLRRTYDYKVYHVLFVDSYHTWWDLGKSYLCRLIDILNSGAVDEIIIGREVFDRWPKLLNQFVK